MVQTALDWYKSYLSDTVQYVHINGCTSPACPLSCGVPQCSVLGPHLFLFMRHHYRNHYYADDMQIYIIVKTFQEDIDAAVGDG